MCKNRPSSALASARTEQSLVLNATVKDLPLVMLNTVIINFSALFKNENRKEVSTYIF